MDRGRDELRWRVYCGGLLLLLLLLFRGEPFSGVP